MELIYVYINSFKNIKDKEFIINNNFNIDVIKENTNNEELVFSISIKNNENNQVKNIYGKNINNITAIIGKNGVGKTNFLNCIGNIEYSSKIGSFFLIYKNYNKDFIIETINIKLKNEKCLNSKSSYSKLKNEKCPNSKSSYSKLFKYKDGKIEYFDSNEINNISSNIEFLFISNEFEYSPSYGYGYNATPPINRFIENYSKKSLYYPFIYFTNKSNYEKYKFDFLELNFEKELIKYNYRQLYLIPNLSYILNYNNNQEILKKLFLLTLLDCKLDLIEHYMNNLQDKPKELSDTYKKIVKQNKNINLIKENFEKNIDKVIESLNPYLNKLEKNIPNNHSIYLNFINNLYDLIKDTNLFNFTFESNRLESTVKLKDIVDNNYIDKFKDLLYFEHKNMITNTLINKSLNTSIKNLSTGFKYLTYLFGALDKSLIKKTEINNNEFYNKNIIILLDEPALHFHPELSRKFINDFKNFLEDRYQNFKFQILITTHSPFIISDIFNDNIIELSNSETGNLMIQKPNINTFGSNIHTLLANSFFMDNTIGEFANQRIKFIIKFLTEEINEPTSNIDEIKNEIIYIINNIGEPIIKSKLKEMYRKKFPKNPEEYELEIQLLQDEQIKLKKQLNKTKEYDIDFIMNLLNQEITRLKKNRS